VLTFRPDGLSLTAAEPWFNSKAQLCYEYIKVFSANAICKADEVMFIDLCAGTGLYSSGHQKEIFPGAGMLSLEPSLPITRWVFYEQDPSLADILKARITRHFPTKNIIIPEIPRVQLYDTISQIVATAKKSGRSMAVLCMVDPFSIDMPFTLIRSLASLGISFLMPFTMMLNQRHDNVYYCDEQGDRLKTYLGTTSIDNLRHLPGNQHFYKKLVQVYQNNMLMLGLNTALSLHKLESLLMQLPAYYIGFFSRQLSAKAIQAEVKASDHLQFELF
jgi:three-Cys-motif partner protein